MVEINPKIDILIVSSDPELTLACKLILTRSGLQNITTMESGVEALKACEEIRYEVILCDKSTKHLSGWLFIQEFKNSPNILNSAVVYFGATPCDQSRDALAEYGILGYAQAPINNKVLMSLLASTLSEIHQTNTIEYRYTSAKDALISKDGDLAEQLYQTLTMETQQNVRSSLGMFHTYDMQSKTQKAWEVAQNLEEKGAKTPTAIIAVIRSMCASKQFDQAIHKAQELVDSTKESALYFAACVEIFNKYACFNHSEIIALKAQKAGFGANLFSLAAARGRFSAGCIDDAIKMIKRAEKDFGASLEGLNLLGVCLRHLNQYEDSRDCYERALKISPMDSKIYFNLAIAETFLNRREAAIRHLKTCLKIAPGYDKAKVKLMELESGQNSQST